VPPWTWRTSSESGGTPPSSEPRGVHRAKVQAVDTGPDDELGKELARPAPSQCRVPGPPRCEWTPCAQ
jgi:hypothetical protein